MMDDLLCPQNTRLNPLVSVATRCKSNKNGVVATIFQKAVHLTQIESVPSNGVVKSELMLGTIRCDQSVRKLGGGGLEEIKSLRIVLVGKSLAQ